MTFIRHKAQFLASSGLPSWLRRRKIQTVLQIEQAECGLACVVMIANYWGNQISLHAARNTLGLSLRGSSFRQLMEVATRYGLSSRALRVELNELVDVQLPAILHWRFSHFVVLEALSAKRAIVHDPEVGRLSVSSAELSRQFTGVVLELCPRASFEPVRQLSSVPVTSLLGSWATTARFVPSLVACVLAVELLSVATPVVLRALVDKGSVGAVALPAYLALGYLVGTGLIALLGLARSALSLRLSGLLSVSGVELVISRLVDLPYRFFESRLPSEIASRLDSLVVIYKVLTSRFIDAVFDGLFAIVILVSLYFIDVRIATVLTLAVALVAGVNIVLSPRLEALCNEELQHQNQHTTEMWDTVRGMQTIQVFSLQEHRRNRLLNKFVKTQNARMRHQSFLAQIGTFQKSVFAVVLLVCALQAVDRLWTAGVVLLVVSYCTQVLLRTEKLMQAMDDLRQVSVHKERLADILATQPERFDRSSTSSEPSTISIEVRDVWFRYSDFDPWILRGVSFSLNAGESIGIAGPSGCGKSTLMKVLLGLLEPTRGEVRINGIPLREFGIETLRRVSASVLQDDRLFSGSIAQNISLFDDGASMEVIVEAARQAGIHDDIERLPMKYHTVVGDTVGGLSAGQRQRVLLARAVFAKPMLLILDEATSHLDPRKESIVNAEIASLNMTRIIVAHRAETLATVDRVVDIAKHSAGEASPAETP